MRITISYYFGINKLGNHQHIVQKQNGYGTKNTFEYQWIKQISDCTPVSRVCVYIERRVSYCAYKTFVKKKKTKNTTSSFYFFKTNLNNRNVFASHTIVSRLLFININIFDVVRQLFVWNFVWKDFYPTVKCVRIKLNIKHFNCVL